MKILLLILTIISIIVSLGTFIWLKKSLGKAVGKEEGDVKDILKKFVVIDGICIAVIKICAIFLLKIK